MVVVHQLGQTLPHWSGLQHWSALLHSALALAIGALVVILGYLAFRRPQLTSRLLWGSAASGARPGGFGLDPGRACGLLAMLVGTGIGLFGVVPADVDVVLAGSFCAVSVLVVLWYGALTA